MTEPMIEHTEAEDFTDELSDEALDRQLSGVKFSGCTPTTCR